MMQFSSTERFLRWPRNIKRRRAALEGLFAERIKPLEIGEILEPLYRMGEQWDRLLTVHEVQLEYQEDPAERVAMMHRLAEIAEERAQDHSRARSFGCSARSSRTLHTTTRVMR